MALLYSENSFASNSGYTSFQSNILHGGYRVRLVKQLYQVLFVSLFIIQHMQMLCLDMTETVHLALFVITLKCLSLTLQKLHYSTNANQNSSSFIKLRIPQINNGCISKISYTVIFIWGSTTYSFLYFNGWFSNLGGGGMLPTTTRL